MITDPTMRISSGESRHGTTPIIVLSVIAGICLVLLLVGAILVGKNSQASAARDPAAATSRGRGIALVVIGCVGVVVFATATGIVGNNYAKLQKERAREVTAYTGNMTFGSFQVKGLGQQFKAIGSNIVNTAAAAVNKQLAPALPPK